MNFLDEKEINGKKITLTLLGKEKNHYSTNE